MKKFNKLLILIAVISLLIIGCGNSAADAGTYGFAAADVGVDPDYGSFTNGVDETKSAATMTLPGEQAAMESDEEAISYDAESTAGSPVMTEARDESNTEVTFDEDRKLIYRSDVTLETLDYNKTYGDLLKLLSKYNGYIQSEEYTNDYGSYLSQTMNPEGLIIYSSNHICVRVPRKDYFKFMEEGLSLGNITNKTQLVEDKTASYATNQAYIEILNKKLEYYDSQLEKLDEELTKAIENNEEQRFNQILRDMEYTSNMKADVESSLIPYKSNNEQIDAESSYATINMVINEVKEYSKPVEVVEEEPTFEQRLSEALQYTHDTIVSGAQNTLIGIIRFIPSLIILLIILAVFCLVAFIAHKIYKQDNKYIIKQKESDDDEQKET